MHNESRSLECARQGVFRNPKQIARTCGVKNARKLKHRLDDLDAAQSLEDMRHLPERREERVNDRAGEFPARLHGGLDRRAIDSIYIAEAVNDHD